MTNGQNGRVLRRLGIAVAALVSFVTLSALSPDAAAVALVFGVIFVFPAFAYVDAMNIPQDVWETSGRSRTGWTIAFWFVPFGVNVAAAIAYWAWFRRRLPGGPLRSTDRVDIASGLHSGQVATLSSRRLFGIAGVWNAVAEDGAPIQVVSTSVRRLSSTDRADHSTGAAERVGDGVAGSLKVRLMGLGCVVVIASVGIVALGLSMGDGGGLFVGGLGAIAAVFGLIQIAHAGFRFRSSRKLPNHLRSSVDRGQPVSLVLSDGRRVPSIVVVPGGFVLPRPWDPPFDARDIVDVQPATEREIADERDRQAVATARGNDDA